MKFYHRLSYIRHKITLFGEKVIWHCLLHVTQESLSQQENDSAQPHWSHQELEPWESYGDSCNTTMMDLSTIYSGPESALCTWGCSKVLKVRAIKLFTLSKLTQSGISACLCPKDCCQKKLSQLFLLGNYSRGKETSVPYATLENVVTSDTAEQRTL